MSVKRKKKKKTEKIDVKIEFLSAVTNMVVTRTKDNPTKIHPTRGRPRGAVNGRSQKTTIIHRNTKINA